MNEEASVPMPEQTTLEKTGSGRMSRKTQLIRPSGGLPLVTIAGAAGKTTTGRLLIQLLEQAGNEVAAWLTDGVYVDRTLRHDELHAWELAAHATRAREIDVLIQEIPSVLAASLPRNSTWIVALTSICGSDEHCQRDEAAQRDQLGVAAALETLRDDGRVVANADDLMLVDAASASSHAITYFAMNGGNPILRNHVHDGGDAVWIQNGWIKVQIAGEKQRLVQVHDLPETLNGHLIFQVQNTLAAIATATTIGLPPDVVAEGIVARTGPGPIPGRGLAITNGAGKVLVADRPSSLHAVKQLMRGVRALGPRRVILVLGLLERLHASDAEEAARVLGSLGGIAILVNPGKVDERLAALRSGLMASDNPPVIIMRPAVETTNDYIQSLLDDGDVALVLDHAP